MKSIKKYFGKYTKIKPIILIAIISSFIFIVDQLTKFFVIHILDLSGRLSITVISGFIYFKMAWNEGINFGLAIGNVLDRIIYGAVADFLNLTCCGIYNPYSFNIADISIFFGVLGIIFFPNSKNQN